MKIVAVDPGETTGFAVYDTKSEELLVSGELFGHFKSCVDFVLSLGDFFIVESFRVRPGAGAALARHSILWPVEWLGAFRYLLSNDQWIQRSPSQVKSVKPLTPSSSPHEADALRLLAYYLHVASRKVLVNAIATLTQ